MPGFPNRVTRAAYGPTYENEQKVLNPKHDYDAAYQNLELHNLAGMGLLSPEASVVIHWTGAAVEIVRRAEAWNPDKKTTSPYDLALPARSGVGIYVINYNATYPDELGELRAIDINDAAGWVVDPESDNHIYHVKVKRVDANSLEARVYEWEVGTSSDWALVDRDFRVVWW